MTCFRVY